MKKAAPRSKGATGLATPRPRTASDAYPRPQRVVYPPDVLSFESEIAYLRGQADLFNARADEMEVALARSKSSQKPEPSTGT